MLHMHYIKLFTSISFILMIFILFLGFFGFFFPRNVECLNLLLSSGTDLNKRDIMGR